MAFNKFLGKFTGNNNDDNDGSLDELDGEDSLSGIAKKDNTMILLEPRAYSESQQIADYLKSNSSVVVNLRRVTPDQAKRIVDFLSGTLYAIEGGLQKLGGGIFLCTPLNVPVEGKISDDKDTKSNLNKRPKQEKDNDDLDWE
jgi:FtsZ-interacting cell division protein YlmF